jgi:hypothetical protein
MRKLSQKGKFRKILNELEDCAKSGYVEKQFFSNEITDYQIKKFKKKGYKIIERDNSIVISWEDA